MANSLENIITELQNLTTAQELLPIWTNNWGFPDFGLSIHSLGTTFLALLGNSLGYVGVAEVPAFKQGNYAHIGDDVRSDAVWFDKISHSPFLIAEFERYTNKNEQCKLEDKAKNLLLAQHRWSETAEILLLAYWRKTTVSSPNHTNLLKIIKEGFETQAKERVRGTNKGQFLLLEFVMRENSKNLLYLSDIILREN